MKLLSCCFLCLFVARVQPKPEIMKLFSVDGLKAYHLQVNNTTKPLMDTFLNKLRDTYNLVFGHFDNSTNNMEKILARGTNSALRTLKLRANQQKLDNYTNLKYPNDSLLGHVKSLWGWDDHGSKGNSSLQKDSTVEVESTIKEDGSNASHVNSDNGVNDGEIKMLNDDQLNDVQLLGQLELQDEEDLDEKTVGTETPDTSVKFPKTMGHNLTEWFGIFFRVIYNLYTKFSSETCNNKEPAD